MTSRDEKMGKQAEKKARDDYKICDEMNRQVTIENIGYTWLLGPLKFEKNNSRSSGINQSSSYCEE